MTNQEKQLANSILESKLSPLDAVKVIVDLKQTGHEDTPISAIYDELRERVFVTHRHRQPVFTYLIEKMLHSFFWQYSAPLMRSYEDRIVEMVESYPKFYEDDFMQDYDEWSFNLADHIQEVLNIPYSWIEIEEDETEPEQNNQ